MNATVTREIVSDLLPLYFAGEVSPDTARLIEAYFAQDPEYADRARHLAGEPAEPLHLKRPDAASERRALQGARRIVRYRGVLLGAALMGTLSPFMFAFGNGGIQWWMARDNPVQAGVLCLAGLVCWILYGVLGAGARRSGI